MKLLFRILTISLTLLTAYAIAHAEDLKGRPRIVDGDTIWIGPTKIRLHGIDARESKQTCKKSDGSEYRCGEMATFALAEIIVYGGDKLVHGSGGFSDAGEVKLCHL